MKEIRRNLRIVGTLIVCLFLGLAAWYAATVYDQGSIWASNVYNQRLSRSNLRRGDILDRRGNILATTDEDGNRVYLSDADDRRALAHTVGDTAGMSGTGVENYYSATLLDVSTSLTDRLSELFSHSQRMGSSVQLTIDGPWTAYVSSIFPQGYNGAVCIMNYKTGEILVMVSKPDYDPYALANRAEEDVVDSAYINRCLQGQYAPGSVFKIVTCASALTYLDGIEQQSITCSSSWKYEGGSIVCGSGNITHGNINLKTALSKSCNVAFGKIAYQLGFDRLGATAENFGFNYNFQFDDLTLYNSSFPTKSGNMSDLVWAGIGQSTVTVSPMHMCMIASSVANGGVMMEPKLVKEIRTSLGVVTKSLSPASFRRVMDASVADKIASYMYEAVKSGTATKAAIPGYTVCGKTGSAETSDNKSKATNAWYVGFLYDDNNPYCISVVIEEGGAGGNIAASLASKALAYCVR